MIKLQHPTTGEPLEAVRLDGRRIGAAELAALVGARAERIEALLAVAEAAKRIDARLQWPHTVVIGAKSAAQQAETEVAIFGLRAAVAALRAVEAGE